MSCPPIKLTAQERLAMLALFQEALAGSELDDDEKWTVLDGKGQIDQWYPSAEDALASAKEDGIEDATLVLAAGYIQDFFKE